MENKNYRVKNSSGGLTENYYTKKEAMQIISMQGGELVIDDNGWKGCIPTIVIVLLVITSLIFWLCS